MHYYKRNIGDYHKKAGRLSMLEHGSYTLLIDACYDRERFPSEQEAIEWCWARSDEEIAAVRFVLSRFFVLRDGFYVQDRIQEEIDSYRGRSLKNKEIAENRERDRREKRERVEHESCTDRHLTTNHKPLTNNQEPEDQKTCAQRAAHDSTFEVFWKLYPLKKSKEPSRKAWLKLKPEGDLLSRIMSGLANQIRSADWLKDGGKFIPHASTWLNQKRWEDEVRYDREDSRGSSGNLSLVDQVREHNRRREEERSGRSAEGPDSFRTFDGEIVGADDEHVRPQMDLRPWHG